MTIRKTVAAILLSISLSPVVAQTIAGVDIQALRAASQGAIPSALEAFGQILNDQNADMLGVNPSVNISQAEVDHPVVDFTIGLERLQTYQSGNDPLQILAATRLISYPLLTGGGYVTSVSLVELDGKWVSASFGSSVSTKAILATRQQIARDGNIPLPEMFQIRVPVLNLVFVAFVQGGALSIAPIFDLPELGLTASRAYPADAVLRSLVPMARAQNSDPG